MQIAQTLKYVFSSDVRSVEMMRQKIAIVCFLYNFNISVVKISEFTHFLFKHMGDGRGAAAVMSVNSLLMSLCRTR